MSCFINGKVFSESEACLRADDLGLQRGYAVFDFARTCNGKLFHINDHLERLRTSASALRLPLKYTDEEIIEIARELIQRSNLRRPAVRFILTGGYTQQGVEFEEPNFIVTAEEQQAYPAEVYAKGGKLITYEYQRELPRVKTTNYLNAIRLEPLRLQKKAFDILYFSNNEVSECPRSNFSMFKGERLITPKDNVLLGITRKIILRLAEDKFIVEERPISMTELKTADEAFVTSTSKRVIPIVQINDFLIGNGVVSHRTRTIMKLFEEYDASY